jgi:hypothetical protein
MILISIGAVGALVGIFGAVAAWQCMCWGVRLALGIPKHMPVYEPEAQPLPWYLDDRIPPPKSMHADGAMTPLHH